MAGCCPGREFGQGDLHLFLLALIADKPAHAYDLIRTIEAKFNCTYAPSRGVICATLTMLEEQELVISEAIIGGKKSFFGTLESHKCLAKDSDQVKALMTRIDIMAGTKASSSKPESIRPESTRCGHAIMAKRWDEGARVCAILEKTARDILDSK